MFTNLEEKIKAYLVDKYGIESPTIEILPNKDSKNGDYYTNCALKYAKECKKNPIEIATELANLLTSEKDFTTSVAKNGLINFTFSTEFLINFLKSNVDLSQQKFKNKKILTEYSSPNIAKPFTVGHLPSTVIGDSLARIYKALGYEVITDNHLGDYGTQFGKLIWAIKKWGSIEEAKKQTDSIKYLVDLYIRFHKEVEIHPEIEEEARSWFLKLENKDIEAEDIWKVCVEISLKEFERIYKELDILQFTTQHGESFYSDKLDEIIKELNDKNLLKKDEGAQLIYFENNKYPPLMILKSDGASLYATRDLATDKFRLASYGNTLTIVNCVGVQQELYLAQVYEVERLLGYVKEGQRKHVKNGWYFLKSGKMSTRKGNVLWLNELLKESYSKSQELLDSKANLKDITDKERQKVISAVAIGSIKWNALKREPHMDVIFDWNEVLSMTGNSAPYIQYTYSRCMSLISKSQLTEAIQTEKMDLMSFQMSDEERQIIKHLVEFTDVVLRSASEFSPHYVCHYLFELCQLFNSYYAKYKIVGEPEEAFRIKIVQSVSNVLKSGLYLLGIKAPERM